jgi:hypothetical protein
MEKITVRSFMICIRYVWGAEDRLRGTQCDAGVKEIRCAYRDLVEKRQVRTPLRTSRLYSIFILKGV